MHVIFYGLGYAMLVMAGVNPFHNYFCIGPGGKVLPVVKQWSTDSELSHGLSFFVLTLNPGIYPI